MSKVRIDERLTVLALGDGRVEMTIHSDGEDDATAFMRPETVRMLCAVLKAATREEA